MPDNIHIPNEGFLHWIWENLHYNTEHLATCDGRTITVLNPGEHNHSDGPDFKRAKIAIDGMVFYGSVEIHTREQEWYAHGHHKQQSYNQVILHVVLKRKQERYKNDRSVLRNDGTSIPTLELFGRLPSSLEKLIQSFQSGRNLHCSSLIHHISKEAIYTQFKKAEKEYFDRKVNEMVSHFNPSLPPTQAWQESLIIGLFDGLGISTNREAMKQLAKRVLDCSREEVNTFDYTAATMDLSGLYGKGRAGGDPINWKRRACRPANRPEVRVRQAAVLVPKVMNTPLDQYLNNTPAAIWNHWFSDRYKPGKQRRKILYGTVFLPALYYLGHLGHSAKMCQTAYKQWQNLRVSYPGSLSTWFVDAGFPKEVYHRKLGAVHQLKRYCRQGRCNECELLKSATSS